MGADTFGTTGRGKDVAHAFNLAVQSALYEHGHGGYTGTLAEKHDYTIIEVPEGVDPKSYAKALIAFYDNGDGDKATMPNFLTEAQHAKFLKDWRLIDDKWGPAGAIRLADLDGQQTWLFFGWASS